MFLLPFDKVNVPNAAEYLNETRRATMLLYVSMFSIIQVTRPHIDFFYWGFYYVAGLTRKNIFSASRGQYDLKNSNWMLINCLFLADDYEVMNFIKNFVQQSSIHKGIYLPFSPFFSLSIFCNSK